MQNIFLLIGMLTVASFMPLVVPRHGADSIARCFLFFFLLKLSLPGFGALWNTCGFALCFFYNSVNVDREANSARTGKIIRKGGFNVPVGDGIERGAVVSETFLGVPCFRNGK